MASWVDDAFAARLGDSDYRQWRAQVQATRGCAAPIHLRGSSRVLDRPVRLMISVIPGDAIVLRYVVAT